MSTIQIYVFISHAWAYSTHYETLSGWIFKGRWESGQNFLNFIDYSVPRDDPIHNTNNDAQLKRALYQRILGSHVVVIPTGMYATYSKWIQKELDGAKEYKKPIIAVNPWGAQRTSSVVSNAANETVGWNKQPVVNAIWKWWNLHYRAK